MKTRVISAIVATLILAPFILMGGRWIIIGVLIAATLGFKEVYELKKSHNPLPIGITLIAILNLYYLILSNYNLANLSLNIPYIKIIILVLSLFIPTIFYKDNKYTTQDAFYLIGMVLFMAFGFNSIIIIRNMGLKLFIYLLLVAFCTDTFAMVFGCMIGKHKMCPTISPKKSWEGSISGLLMAIIIPSMYSAFVLDCFSYKVIITSALLSIAGQIGDLLFSKIKRENEIKDFSNIMPGHGGVLDRLDSTFVIFITYILIYSILF